MAGGHDDPSTALDDGAHGGASCGAKRAQPMATGRKVTPLNNRSNKPFLVTQAVVARRQTREALNPLAHQESGGGMERLWSRADATSGDRRQIREPRKRLKQAEFVALDCR